MTIAVKKSCSCRFQKIFIENVIYLFASIKMLYLITEGVQCAVVDVTDTGFTMPEVIIMEGQGILFEKGGRKTVEIVQVSVLFETNMILNN